MVGPKTIELYSELEPDKHYSIEGIGYVFLGTEGDTFKFAPETYNAAGNDLIEFQRDDLQHHIEAGDVKTIVNPEIEQTLSNFPKLDRFTRHTFGVPTHTLLDLAGLNETDLYTLEEMIERHHLTEMPLPGEGKYDSLLADEHWPTLKHYLKAISPDIDLPEELG